MLCAILFFMVQIYVKIIKVENFYENILQILEKNIYLQKRN
jgi:hypothetical protein